MFSFKYYNGEEYANSISCKGVTFPPEEVSSV